MTQRYPSLSLCMIVRDEADFIAQCISSVQSIVSEIIVVDTGSTDATMEIAKSLGARVLQRPWDDDFSAPRNLALESATGDWILVLDADEAIAATDLKTLQEHTLKPAAAFELLQRHYSNDQRISLFQPCKGEYPEWERNYGGYFTSNLCRLFPNRSAFAFRNRVHELIEPSITEDGSCIIYRSPVPIHHYGHTETVRKERKKTLLYVPLGTRKIQDNPANWKNHFEMAVEYNCSGKLLESVLAFRTAAALHPEYTQTWINLGYVLNELQAFSSALEVLSRALALEPANPEAHCNIAVTYMRLQQMAFAESHLRRALKEKPDYVNALCNLGQVYASTQKLQEAETCYREALTLFPHNATALTDLGAVLTQQKRNREAITILKKSLSIDNAFQRTYYYLGHAYKQIDRVTEALEIFEKLVLLTKTNTSDPALLAAIQKTYQTWQQEAVTDTTRQASKEASNPSQQRETIS